MKISEIPEQLEAMGYRSEICTLAGDRMIFGDDLVLERVGNQFRICDMERGKTTGLNFQCDKEGDACAYFLDVIAGRSRHLITSKSQHEIERVQSMLIDAGLAVWRNDILHLPGPPFPQFRLFVRGADYTAAADLLLKGGAD